MNEEESVQSRLKKENIALRIMVDDVLKVAEKKIADLKYEHAIELERKEEAYKKIVSQLMKRIERE